MHQERRHGAPRTQLAVLASVMCTLQWVHSCTIQGVDMGECVAPQDFVDEMPFCSTSVRYTACLPKAVPHFPNLTAANKDAWAAAAFSSFVSTRIEVETGRLSPDDPST